MYSLLWAMNELATSAEVTCADRSANVPRV